MARMVKKPQFVLEALQAGAAAWGEAFRSLGSGAEEAVVGMCQSFLGLYWAAAEHGLSPFAADPPLHRLGLLLPQVYSKGL